jgi:hypothetical protein
MENGNGSLIIVLHITKTGVMESQMSGVQRVVFTSMHHQGIGIITIALFHSTIFVSEEVK